MKTKAISTILIFILLIIISCQKENNYKILTERIFGKGTHVYYIFLSEEKNNEMQKIAEELFKENIIAIAYFYNDTTKLSKSRFSNDMLESLPYSGYVGKYDKYMKGIHRQE